MKIIAECPKGETRVIFRVEGRTQTFGDTEAHLYVSGLHEGTEFNLRIMKFFESGDFSRENISQEFEDEELNILKGIGFKFNRFGQIAEFKDGCRESEQKYGYRFVDPEVAEDLVPEGGIKITQSMLNEFSRDIAMVYRKHGLSITSEYGMESLFVKYYSEGDASILVRTYSVSDLEELNSDKGDDL